MTPTIVIGGSLAQRPGAGGHAWVFLQYLLGFRRLGWQVVFVDWLAPAMCVDHAGNACPPDKSENARYLVELMRRFGFEDSFCLLCDGMQDSVGLTRAGLERRLLESQLFLNVNGYVADDALLGAAPRRVFLDIDPGFTQMWRELGLHDPFPGYDDYVTVAQNIGHDDCTIPTCGLEWITTRQPVVLEEWPPAPPSGGSFTSVATWRGPYAPIEYEGRDYGLRVHEFRRFAEIPSRSARSFELALDIDDADARDLTLLRRGGWSVVAPGSVTGDPWSYRRYIRRSAAEFTIAKGMYVASNSGWFSDRSACYLASGKPVLAQETGFSRDLPTGEGLLSFSSVNEALDGVQQISSHYERHAHAARAVAGEYFDSGTVLTRMLEEVQVG